MVLGFFWNFGEDDIETHLYLLKVPRARTGMICAKKVFVAKDAGRYLQYICLNKWFNILLMIYLVLFNYLLILV